MKLPLDRRNNRRNTDRISIFFGIVISAWLTACGDPGSIESGDQAGGMENPPGASVEMPDKSVQEESQASDETVASTESETTASPSPEVVTVEDGNATVKLTSNDTMQYNVNRFEVPAGSEVTIKLEHVGKLPRNAMGHNVVILKQGVDVAAYNAAAAKALQNDFFPPERKEDVVAHTDLVGGGESTSVTFSSPVTGEYDYLCTFPGHYQAGMKGKMIVVQ